MHELVSQIVLQVTLAWRRRWHALAVAWLVCLAGWFAVAIMPDVYESSARVYVNTESLLRPLLKGLAVETNPDRELDIMQRTLKSRPNMEKVARMADLDLTAEGPAEMDNLVRRLQQGITVRSEARNLFTIGFQHTDPIIAHRVVQAMLTIYMESNLGTSRQEMDAARGFIDDQIQEYERQLEAAEQRLANFKQANMNVMPGNTGYYQRLDGARGELDNARSNLANAIALQRELQRQLADIPQFIESVVSDGFGGPPLSGGFGGSSDLPIRIAELEKTIDDLLIRYTEKHPDVVATQRRLDALKMKLQEETERAAAASPGDDKGLSVATEKAPNALYEQVKLQLVASGANVAALRGNVSRAAARVASLEALANRVPAIEAELTRLNRDYGIIKRNYETLLGRRESARISENRETKREAVLFRIVDPPRVPNIPSGPQRLLMLIAVLVIGLGAGIAFAMLLANLRPTFLNVESLKTRFGIPVLGGVSYVVSSAEKSWRAAKLAGFSLAIVALLGMFGGLYATEISIGLPNAVPEEVASKVKGQFDHIFSTNEN